MAFDPRLIDDLARRLAGSVPESVVALRRDLEQNFKGVLQAQLTRLDLVSREEFDVQAAVLKRTREKLAALEARIDELIDRLDMAEFADRRAKGFSQGQRTKVALARALVHAPRTVILDEPTSGLDVMATRALRQLIRDLRGQGHCVLFSSHVMQEVAALCDEIVIIDHGRLAGAGTPEEIRARFGGETLEEAFVNVLGEQEGLA